MKKTSNFSHYWFLILIEGILGIEQGKNAFELCKVFEKWLLPVHRGYKWIIMWQKCKGMCVNGFIFKKLNKNTKDRKRSLGPFRICLLNSRTNPTNLHLDWAELAMLFSRQILNDPQDVFLSFIFKSLFISLDMKTLRSLPLHFYHLIIHLKPGWVIYLPMILKFPK